MAVARSGGGGGGGGGGGERVQFSSLLLRTDQTNTLVLVEVFG